MPYIVYSIADEAPVVRCDGRLSDIMLRAGEVAIPCAAGADPNDPAWADEAANYEARHAVSNARTLALDRIDRAASDARARHITTGAGQEATYQLKADEAAAFIAAGRPADTSAYPLLTAEATATGSTVSNLADAVQVMRQQWVQLAAYIEGVRMGNKAAAVAATDMAGIAAAVASAEAQLGAV